MIDNWKEEITEIFSDLEFEHKYYVFGQNEVY